MKRFWLVLLLAAVAGCQTSTVESRRAERAAAYAALTPEMKGLVDQGQIRVGMGEDAVYIAWGPPSQVLHSQNQSATTTTWLYHGAWMEESRYWAYREIYRDNVLFLERYLARDYSPRSFVQAEITFEGGKVKAWRTLPKPL